MDTLSRNFFAGALRLFRVIASKAGIDRAVRWTLLTQLLRFATGPVTILLILRYLTPEMQGFSYAFGSVLAISIFLELGFSQSILQFVSHEFSKLRFGEGLKLEGDEEAKSRLISIGRLSFRYYGIAAALFAVVVVVGGRWFFSSGHGTGVHWQTPWILACISSSISLAINPAWALIEGCDRIADVERFRFWSSLTTFVLLTAGYVCGLGLYTGPVASLLGVVISVVYLLRHWGGFLGNFLIKPARGMFSWSREMWPFQWRIAVSWMSGYLLFSAVVPIIFRLQGPVAAGQYGSTANLVAAIAAVASSWSTTKLPRYGMLVAREDWPGLLDLWRRASLSSVSIALLGGTCLVAGLAVLGWCFPAVGARFGGTLVAALLCGCMVIQTMVNSCAYLLRAFRKDPYMWLSVIGAALNVTLIYWLTSRLGILGAAAGYAICNLIMLYPNLAVFERKRLQFMGVIPLFRRK